MIKPNYFIVVGRLHGDDEASAVIVQAPTSFAAVEAFNCEILSIHNIPYDPDDELPDDGIGAVYVDHVFDCGDHKPDQRW